MNILVVDYDYKLNISKYRIKSVFFFNKKWIVKNVESSIDDDDDSFQCDGCIAFYHIRCVGIKKSEWNARKNSKCLKLYCEKCCDNPSIASIESLKIMLNYIYKIDMKTQKQEEKNSVC